MPEVDTRSTDRLKYVTHGFLVAIETRKGVSGETMRDCMKESAMKWWGTMDVEYLGEIDCYDEKDEKKGL